MYSTLQEEINGVDLLQLFPSTFSLCPHGERGVLSDWRTWKKEGNEWEPLQVPLRKSLFSGCAFSSQFPLLGHSLGFWVSGSVRSFRIGFHGKIGYRDERKGVMPKKERWIGSSREPPLAWGQKKNGGRHRYPGPGSRIYWWKVEPWQASSAGSRSREGIRSSCCTRHHKGREGKIPLFLLSHQLPTSHQCTPYYEPRWHRTREMQPLQTTRLHSTEQGKGDDGSESRKTQDTHSRYIQLRGRDTRKPDCGHIPKPVLNVALSLIKLNIIIIFT